MASDAFVYEEAFNLLCGDVIAYGMSRTVYACKLLPECVVKVEQPGRHFQNVTEWTTWQQVKDTPASRWFAGVRWISPSGAVLVMERTRPPAPVEFPERVPVFLTDLKRTNFGMVTATKGGKAARDWLVCHDYGTTLIVQDGTATKRTKRAEWWDEE